VPAKPDSSLQFDSITVLAAPLGESNPLPPLRPFRYIADEVMVDDSVSDVTPIIAHANCNSLLPKGRRRGI
jgi:hypothetical protein